MLGKILLVFALVLSICAAAGISLPRVQLGWAALAFFFAYLLLGATGLR